MVLKLLPHGPLAMLALLVVAHQQAVVDLREAGLGRGIGITEQRARAEKDTMLTLCMHDFQARNRIARHRMMTITSRLSS